MPKKKPQKKRRSSPRSPRKTTLPVPIRAPVAREALQAYLASIQEHPLLSPQDEFDFAKAYYEQKDADAAKRLILSNLRLVVKIAFEYLRTGLSVLDLIQEGNIGILHAVRKYDPYKGVKFSSYASYWIKAFIRNFILKNWSLVKIGTTRAQRALFYRLQKEKNKMEIQGINPSVRLLAERLDVKDKDIIEMSQRLKGRDVSLFTPLGSQGDEGSTMIQLIADPQKGADEKLAEHEIKEEFSERLNSFERTLSGKELLIFRERLRAEEPKTLQAIGDIYGVTRERARQIEARVLTKLKDYMKENAKFRDSIIDVPKKILVFFLTFLRIFLLFWKAESK